MPAENHPRPPVEGRSPGKPPQPTLAGLFGECQQPTYLDLDSAISRGAKVPSAFGKKEIDLGGPVPDVEDDERDDRGLVGFS